MCSRMELSLTAPRSAHSLFYFPGCQVDGRLFLRGVSLNTLYTAILRHVAVVELRGRNNTSLWHDSKVGDASTTLQFMCVTEEQRAQMPSEMSKSGIALHAIPEAQIRTVMNGLNGTGNSLGGGSLKASPQRVLLRRECDIIEDFGLRLLESGPNSFKCGAIADCNNFIEVSTTYGFPSKAISLH